MRHSFYAGNHQANDQANYQGEMLTGPSCQFLPCGAGKPQEFSDDIQKSAFTFSLC